MAGTDTISIFRGESVEFDFTMTPVEDITGWAITLTVRGAGAVLSTDGTITDPTAGEFYFTLASSVTVLLIPGNYIYDVWRTDVDQERLLAVGQFTVLSTARIAA